MFPDNDSDGETDPRLKLKKSIILKAKEKRLKNDLKRLSFTETREERMGRLLFAAVSNYTCLDNLLKQGIDVNTKDYLSRTALHFAASSGDVSIIQLLFKYNANPNVTDIIGNTPLHLAACKGLSSVVKVLISNGADIKAVDRYGRNPLEVVESKLRTLGDMNILPESVQGNMLQVIDLMKSFTKLSESEAALMKLSLNSNCGEKD